jgi:hypothetical protein
MVTNFTKYFIMSTRCRSGIVKYIINSSNINLRRAVTERE